MIIWQKSLCVYILWKYVVTPHNIVALSISRYVIEDVVIVYLMTHYTFIF